MRTTVTLYPDVERLIRSVMPERRISFNEALNETVRKGVLGQKRRRPGRFVQKSFSMGQKQDLRWDKALAIARELDDEELSRKLLLRSLPGLELE